MSSKKSSPKQQPQQLKNTQQPAPVKKQAPERNPNARRFLNESFLRTVIKDTNLNKTEFNQITPVALKYLVLNFSLLEDSLRFLLKNSSEYLEGGKSPRTKVTDSVSKLATKFFLDAMKDDTKEYESYVSELVSSCSQNSDESFTNKIIKKIFCNFLNSIPEHMVGLGKKSSKTLDLTQIVLCVYGSKSSVSLKFVHKLFPSFLGIPLSVEDKGRMVPSESFLQKCAFEGRKKREAYTILKWYLNYVVDQLSNSDRHYLDVISKLTKSSSSTNNRNLVINFSNVILYGVNGCAGTQEMISRISNVDLSINSGNLENIQTFVHVESKQDEVKEKKKNVKKQKATKEQQQVVEEQPVQQQVQEVVEVVKTLKTSQKKQKQVTASSS